MGILPRVVVDARMVGDFGHGIANYVVDLAYGLADLRGQGKLTYDLIFLVHGKGNRSAQLANFPVFSTRFPFLNPMENWEVPNVLTELRADLYHSPSFSSLAFCPCPYIQTIHDLNHRHFGNPLQKLYYAFHLRRFAESARQLITVSDFSRQEIAEWLRIPPSEIEIVENAVRITALERAAGNSERHIRELGLTRGKYFLALSSMKPHKNLRFLAAAHEEYQKQQGRGAWPLVLPVDSSAFSNPGILSIGPQSEEHAMQLLKYSGALAFPSSYEGFGRPPVEAAALGVPLLVSDIAPHREVLRGLKPEQVRFLPVRDSAAWVAAMKRAEEGGLVRPDASALAWIEKNFSVRNLAEKMDSIYKRTIRRFDSF